MVAIAVHELGVQFLADVVFVNRVLRKTEGTAEERDDGVGLAITQAGNNGAGHRMAA
jgi:hypothetical protein